jgi:predicted SnoaL-like aldol condensation-catalyzing enzyme
MRMARPVAAICLTFLTFLNGARAADLESNKQLVRGGIEEVFNKRQPAAQDRYIAIDYIEHNPRLPQGLDGQKKFVARVLAAFSDYHADIQDIIAEGDRVMVRIQWTGTQDGPYQGQPPSSRKVSFTTADIFRIADGKLAEHWDVVDSLQRALTLGQVTPVNPPGAPPPKVQ